MTQAEQQTAAKQFAEYWQDKGDEKQETQRFWIELLQTVLGVENPAQYIEFEKSVQLKHTSFIDGYIPATKVLIEQKGAKIDLHKAYEQSDGSVLTPYQQAKRYADEMPYSLRPAWIVVCNFREFLIYNMENPHAEPTQILLENLAKDYYLLDFISRHKTESLQRELELSIEAGKIVGELYDELLKQYKKKDDFELKSLNMLCVRLVFCLYAEDSGIFGKRLMFHDFLASFNAENVRTALIELFRVLDTPSEEEKDRLHLPAGTETRDPYLDEKFAQFPYVNGGLFKDEKILIPPFNDAIRDFLLNKASSFDWSEISPTIFGAVFESTLNPDTRRSGGMHYTSIENIHKVIDPLFMDALWEEFAAIVSDRPVIPVLDAGISAGKDYRVKPDNDKRAHDNDKRKPAQNSVIPVLDTGISLTKKQKERLLAFQKKLGSLTFLDPACGSGNFLTETYLSLRRLENRVIALLNQGERVFGFDEFICVKISQFYGIEINDFAVTVAKTALWIAESQMISETEQIVSQTIDFLPLTTNAFIVEGNALRMDWATFAENAPEFWAIKAETTHIYQTDDLDSPLVVREPTEEEIKHFKDLNVITKNVVYEIPEAKEKSAPIEYDFIMGNPPFVGYSFQSERQKEDMLLTFTDEGGKPYKGAGKIDYVSAWYFKAARFIQGKKTRCAFVSTNSVTQGEQVASVWKPILTIFKAHIDFAWRTFRWQNETADKAHMAAVHCVIVGFSHAESEKQRIIFQSDGTQTVAKNINPYLLDAPNLFIESRSKPLCAVPLMTTGNRPADGGHLIIEADEYEEFIKKEPGAKKFIKRLLGSEEFINGKKRYCLWLVGANPSELLKLPLVMKRVEDCRKDRSASPDAGRQKLAQTPTLFREQLNPESFLLVPKVSSERRKYVPIGFFGGETISTDLNFIVPNAGLYEFGILTSNVHNAWMRSVCGRMKSDYRYSVNLVYNTFPWCNPNDEQKLKIEQTAQTILDARAKFPDCTLAQLYGENSYLFPELVKAHQANDRAVMEAYGFAGTRGHAPLSEAEIVAELFKMYEKLCANLTNLLP